ncbi:hypothetical protein JG688_00002368 [Phytophthora aleatoria]|uniref:Integrase catalytic domain-containing protein n=1 Tax=Phytophthora aleatoria TaxID=2496075 RepID=A0A8J5MCT2_9STRA|nr:hypothetical protein JG688_00002368 [Phytophthora aleatoria]
MLLCSIKVLRTDGGIEFLNKDIRKVVRQTGIVHEHMTRYSSFQNGAAERTIRTFAKMASAMLAGLWIASLALEDALKHTAFIRNRSPRENADVTLHERIFGLKPDVSVVKRLMIISASTHQRPIWML